LQPDPRRRFDFSTPQGEPALISADSVSWRVFKNPVVLLIGGVAAVLLELAEPRVRDAIWHHSRFRSQPLARLQRTGLSAMVTVYGPRSAAEAMIAGVAAMHRRVNGRTSDGEPYDATDPELLNWVQATASFGFMQAYHSHVRRLAPRERDALLAEARMPALLYGAVGAPGSQAELSALFEATNVRLAASPIIFEFLEIMTQLVGLPKAARPVQRLPLKAAIDILPARLRERLGLGAEWSLSPWERGLVRAVAAASDHIALPSSPAVQSCRRLGLPHDYLYRLQ
jgi:uncharacterized protein (DUF2236 family)